MSNHVHLVIERRSVALEDIMSDLKKYTSTEIIKAIEENPQENLKDLMLWMFERSRKKNTNSTKYQFWQQHNQPIELTTEAFASDSSIDYIHNNPVKAGFVDKPEHYSYSSAIDFAGGKGLVNIEPCF